MTWKHRGRTIMIMGSGPVIQQSPELEDNLYFSSRPSPRQEGGRHTEAGHSLPVPSFLLRTKAGTLGPEFPLFILSHLRSGWQEDHLADSHAASELTEGLTGFSVCSQNHWPTVSTQGFIHFQQQIKIFGLRFKIYIRDSTIHVF